MDTNKIIENLMNISSKEDTFKSEMFEEAEYWWIRKGTGIFLDEEGFSYFNTASDGVFEDEFIKDNFPVEYINDKLKDIISETSKLEEDKRTEFIEDNVNSLRDNLKSEIKEWVFWIPIHNLSINETMYVGNVKLFIFDNAEAEKIKRTEIYKDHVDEISEYLINPNIDKTLAEVKVRGIQDYAKLLAIKKINLAINSLKLFIHQDDSQFGIEGEVFPSIIRRLYAYSGSEEVPFLLTERVGELRPFELDEEKLEFMKKHGFDELSNILKKDSISDYESRLLNSIYWFGEALSISIHDEKNLVFRESKRKHENLEYFNYGEKAVKLFTALESVLIFNKDEPLTENMSERVAMIRGNNYERRKKIKSRIKELYDIRSTIVHDGNVFVSKYDVWDLSEQVRWVLIDLIKLKIEFDFKSRGDLRKYIDKLKFT